MRREPQDLLPVEADALCSDKAQGVYEPPPATGL